MHTHTFIRSRNEPYLPLPSQVQLVLIYRPRRDGRLSRPWCKVASAEIRTRNLPIANPALYHTASSDSSVSRLATPLQTTLNKLITSCMHGLNSAGSRRIPDLTPPSWDTTPLFVEPATKFATSVWDAPSGECLRGRGGYSVVCS